MNANFFLKFGGLALIILAILGFVGVTGPTASDSIFGSVWWFDAAECWALMVVGVISLIVGYVATENFQKPFALAVGLLSILFAAWTKYVDPEFLGINIEFPIDLVWYSIFGLWGALSAVANHGKK
ncbi:MAG: hypothetical protein US76_01195 [Parcubacteria group bacterium GW2011_GWA2_38_13b]|nr:MAG: hypothetical protein US76_01195 [Parcubacteria group bacterium GW2011_GWA2_38_13b]